MFQKRQEEIVPKATTAAATESFLTGEKYSVVHPLSHMVLSHKLRLTNQDGYGQDVNHAEAAVCGYVDGGINAAVILFELNSSSATCSLPETAKNNLREALGFSSKTALGSGITILPPLK